MLDEIDVNRKSAVAREEDDDMSPGENCCYVCVSEFSLFKKKQTCMNWYVIRNIELFSLCSSYSIF